MFHAERWLKLSEYAQINFRLWVKVLQMSTQLWLMQWQEMKNTLAKLTDGNFGFAGDIVPAVFSVEGYI